MLTVKSDDIRGRLKTYERIVKGQNLSKPGVPESFRVLVKELQGLGLDVEVKYTDGTIGELVMEEDEDEMMHFTSRPSSVAAKEQVAAEEPAAETEEDDIEELSEELFHGDLTVFPEDVESEGADE
jgi:DNA-directed RNA polymerase subunit beta (EC 2.7.7.6)